MPKGCPQKWCQAPFQEVSLISPSINIMHISIYDEEHSSEEDRWVTVGMDLKTRTLVVVHTFITVNKKNCNIRIISARKATKNERNFYTKG